MLLKEQSIMIDIVQPESSHEVAKMDFNQEGVYHSKNNDGFSFKLLRSINILRNIRVK